MDFKKLKIFISHHHKYAKEVKEGLSFLDNFGLELFIAHYDTEEGKDFVETIGKEIKSCDLFLYFCTESANNSLYCQQELGMAKGLKKDIIFINNFGDDKDKANPMGMFKHTQAYRFKDFPSLVETIFQKETVKDFFKEQFKKNDIIIPDSTTPYFEKITQGDWNDFGFFTRLKVKHPLIKNEEIIFIKVAYKGQVANKRQSAEEYSFNMLPKFFPYLGEKFFSFLENYDVSELEDNEEEILHLLNDVRVLEEEKFNKIKEEPVYYSSICRKDLSTNFTSMEEPRETYNKKRKIYNKKK